MFQATGGCREEERGGGKIEETKGGKATRHRVKMNIDGGWRQCVIMQLRVGRWSSRGGGGGVEDSNKTEERKELNDSVNTV